MGVSCVFLDRGYVMCLCICIMRVACGFFVCFSGSWVCHVFVQKL